MKTIGLMIALMLVGSSGYALRGAAHVQARAAPHGQQRGEAHAHVRRSRAHAEKEVTKTGENARIRAYCSTEKSTERTGETNKQASTGDRKKAVRHAELSGDKRNRVLTAFHQQANLNIRRTPTSICGWGGAPRDFGFVLVPLSL
jgi:hypothetical protein